MNVLWVGDAVVNSGFSVVTHNICNHLYKKCKLEVFGIRYNQRVEYDYPYRIYPGETSGDIYSFDYLPKVIEKAKADVVVLFNDDHIIERYLALLSGTKAKIVPLFPINLLPLDKERILGFSNSIYNVAKIMTYTDFAKKEVKKINPNLEVHAVYHGVDRTVFSPLPEAKYELGLKDYFVVGNVNVNTYRKRVDLFLEGFAKFAKGKEDVKCLIHAINNDVAYNLPMIINDLGIADKTILSPSSIEFSGMNLLYNLMDVNVNTSLGEGFGLSLVEGAACGIPILCAEHGNLVDIWGNNADYIGIERSEYVAGTVFKGSVISVDDFADKLDRLYADRLYLAERKRCVLGASKDPKFNWSTIADKVFKVLSTGNSGKISYVSDYKLETDTKFDLF